MATTAVVNGEQVQELELSLVVPSKNNPRKSFGDAAMLDLMESIKIHGVTSPILTRQKNGKHEIVFGERRFRASKELGRATIPAIVRELSDEQADELRFVENLQREDLSPVEEAKEYERRWKGISPADISAKIGKPESHVVQRLRLLKLIGDAQAALNSDKILLGHAFELCKLREDEQKTTLKWLLSARVEVSESRTFAEVKTHYSVEALKKFVQANFLLVLAHAPFDTTDINLYPAMGACTDCQYNTANLGTLFPGVKDARCTVPDCFAVKTNKALLADIKAYGDETGKKVYQLGIGNAYYNRGSKNIVDGYFNENDSRITQVEKGKECESTQPAVVTFVDPTLGLKATPGKRLLICIDEKCKVHHGAPTGAARQPLKGLAKVEHKEKTLEQERGQRVREEAFKQLAAKLLAKAKLGARAVSFLCLAKYVQAHLFSDRFRDMGKALGIERPEKKSEFQGADWEGAVVKHFAANRSALILAMVAAEGLSDSDRNNALYGMAAEYKVDVKKIERAIAVEDKAEIKVMRERAKEREKNAAKPKKVKAEKKAASAKKGAKKKH